MEFIKDMPLNKRIKHVIDERGLKIKSVAEKSGIKPYVFYRMLEGSRYIKTDEMAQIAKALEIDIADFFKGAK
jgi:predicted transcriptional regulator